MSSEEMRTELEIFVNEGLREGWRGWPRHNGRGLHRTTGTDGTNRRDPKREELRLGTQTYGTVPGSGCSDRSYESYPSYTSN